MHDTRERVWRHLNFFQYKAFIHAAMPRVTCPVHGMRTVVLLQCLFDRFGSVFP